MAGKTATRGWAVLGRSQQADCVAILNLGNEEFKGNLWKTKSCKKNKSGTVFHPSSCQQKWCNPLELLHHPFMTKLPYLVHVPCTQSKRKSCECWFQTNQPHSQVIFWLPDVTQCPHQFQGAGQPACSSSRVGESPIPQPRRQTPTGLLMIKGSAIGIAK